MVVALRFASLAVAGILTVLALALPAQAEADCEASAEGSASTLGGSCSAALPSGETATICAGADTTDGYLFEFDVLGLKTNPGCEPNGAGQAGCQAWQYDADLSSSWLYPNAGAACLAPILEGDACVGLADDGWFTPYAGTESMGTDCKHDGAGAGCVNTEGAFYECNAGATVNDACFELLDEHQAFLYRASARSNPDCGPERIPFE